MEVRFYEPGAVADALLRFAVVLSRAGEAWVFCKHRERSTLEIPGGRREAGEAVDDTAKRELREETGAIDFAIKPVCVYSVSGKNSVNQTGEETFGMLYYASIAGFEEELHSEIERVVFLDGLPQAWTYPEIQPLLLAEYQRRARLGLV